MFFALLSQSEVFFVQAILSYSVKTETDDALFIKIFCSSCRNSFEVISTNTFYRKKNTQHCFLNDAISEIENDDPETADIVMIGPPILEVQIAIRKVKNEEILEATGLPNEVAGEVEVFQITSNEVISDSDSKEQGSSEQTAKRAKKLAKRNDNVKWEKKHIQPKPTSSLDQHKKAQAQLINKHPDLVQATISNTFESTFSDMAEFLVNKTNRYATENKNKPEFSVSMEEMKQFIGLIFLAGYNMRLSERDYWSADPDLRCDAFCTAMSRNRFFEIKVVLHAANNQHLSDCRMAKVKPLYDILNKKLRRFGVVHEDLSVDESMVPYYGRHSCKQFIRGKPIRFGYKLWVLASSTGLPYHVEIYEGKSPNTEDVPLGERVVKTALEICDNPVEHSVFFDNFFSSSKLLVDLDAKGFRATGAMRKNWIGKCPLADVHDMKKRESGSYDFRGKSNLEIVRWNENSVVTIGSNAYGVEPVGNAKRWIRGKGRGNISQPAVIAAYNRRMGGVDLLDRALSNLRPVIRGKKWYWPLIINEINIINAINIAFVYSWRLYRIISGEALSQKEFRRRVVSIMILRSQIKSDSQILRRSSSQIMNVRSRPARTLKVADEIRLDGIGHYPFPAPVRRCVICEKKLPQFLCKM